MVSRLEAAESIVAGSYAQFMGERAFLETPYREVALFANVCASGTESRDDTHQRTRYELSIVPGKMMSGVEHGEATHGWYSIASLYFIGSSRCLFQSSASPGHEAARPLLV